MQISLIATVLNEGPSLRRLLDSILNQTRLPDEVVICDGGSTDGTLDILQEYSSKLPIAIVERPGFNISQGRNIAVESASFEVIAVTDAGVHLDPDWLARLVEPLQADPDVQAVAGFFKPDPHTPFELAMGATVLPEWRDLDPAAFLPSSRSIAFRRAAWRQVVGYPEWLDFCEDLIFDLRLKASFGPFAAAPDAIVYFRPRHSLMAFFKQYYQYARGDGKANLFFRRHLIRYLTYFVVLPLLLFAALSVTPWAFLLLLTGGVYMVAIPYRRLFNQWVGSPALDKLVAAFWVPVIRITGDIAKMIGYPPGVLWRIRNRPPAWRLDSSAAS